MPTIGLEWRRNLKEHEMFVQFLIVAAMITVAGPGHNEGGFQAIKDNGVKSAFEKAWDGKQPLDYSKLND